MNLAKDRFYKSTLHKAFWFKDKPMGKAKYTRYTYESAEKLYDIDVRNSDGDVTYHTNQGFDVPPNRFHKEIEKHFNLKPKEK